MLTLNSARVMTSRSSGTRRNSCCHARNRCNDSDFDTPNTPNASTHAGHTSAARPEPRRQASLTIVRLTRKTRSTASGARCATGVQMRPAAGAASCRSPEPLLPDVNRLEYILHARTMSRLRSSVALDVLSLLLGLVAARGLVRERGRAGRRSLSAGPSNLSGESPKEGKPCCRGARYWRSPRLQPQRPFDVPGIQTRPPRNHQLP